MKRFKIVCIILMCLLSSHSVISCHHAADERPCEDKTFSFHGIPRPNSFVSDHDSILTIAQYKSLNQECKRIKEEIDVSLINLILKSAGVKNFKKEFADSLFNVWGIGDSITNRGMLIAISIEERQIAIVTGLGLENEYPDSLCAEIIQDMIPYCQEEEYYNALSIGTNDIRRGAK